MNEYHIEVSLHLFLAVTLSKLISLIFKMGIKVVPVSLPVHLKTASQFEC